MDAGNRISHRGRYTYIVDNLCSEAGKEPLVRLWVALPFTRPGQDATVGAIDPEPSRIFSDELGGNRIAFWEFDEIPRDGSLSITVDFAVEAEEVRTAVDPGAVEAYDRESPEFERFTRSEPWLERTPEIVAAAREAVGDEKNPYLAARLIFDWVLREMNYEYPDMDSRGVAKSFPRRKGDCGEFSFAFVAMCRAVGIPARNVICNWFTGSGHVWAEFLCPPYGWIPADTSVAEAMSSGGEALGGSESIRNFCKNRNIPYDNPHWLFGNLYANRLVVFVGTNVRAGEKTFFFMQPGGVASAPEGFEAVGCGDKVVHGGFFLFDEGWDDPERARETARREMAKAYYDAGLPDRAEEGFRLIVKERPKDTLAWFHLGEIHRGRGELGPAIEAFGNCIAGQGGSLQPVLGAIGQLLRGNCLDLEGRREEALADYEAVVESGVDFQGIDEVARGHLTTPYTGDD